MSSQENTLHCKSFQNKTIKIKSKKSGINKQINNLHPINNIQKDYLTYDFNIDDEYKKNINIDVSSFNIERINSLPTLDIDIINTNSDDPELDDDYYSEEIENKENDIDIDIDSLEKDTIGNKTYYFDYTKGIIYDLNYTIIGHIDEIGEINIA